MLHAKKVINPTSNVHNNMLMLSCFAAITDIFGYFNNKHQGLEAISQVTIFYIELIVLTRVSLPGYTVKHLSYVLFVQPLCCSKQENSSCRGALQTFTRDTGPTSMEVTWYRPISAMYSPQFQIMDFSWIVFINRKLGMIGGRK